MSRDTSPTRDNLFEHQVKELKWAFDGCRRAYGYIVQANRGTPPKPNKKLTAKQIEKILRKNGRFEYNFFVHSGYAGEGSFVKLESSLGSHNLTVTYGHRGQDYDTENHKLVELLDVLFLDWYRLFGYTKTDVYDTIAKLSHQKTTETEGRKPA